ncbi:MAG: AAA family ATPase [Thermoanaerobaculia bacterium]|nr:AAA family ATPase [Thermoanaerobaculia bacterium]
MASRFGDFELATESFQLFRQKVPVHLEPRVFEVLCYLYKHRTRVVSKGELLDALWGDDFVTESALTRAIRDLRRGLGETGDKKGWIRTVYGRGFRFAETTSADTRTATGHTQTLHLVERERELNQLAELLSESKDEGRIALVLGEAGIGKTALLESFVASFAPLAVWGGCDALFTPRPLAPVQDLAKSLGGVLKKSIASGSPRFEIFQATLVALEQANKPCVVVVEDLHWADEATLDWLKFLGRRLAREPGVLLVATYRDDEIPRGHPLRSVLGELPGRITRRLRLEPLSADGVEQLARLANRTSADLWRTTGGNPFFVSEALAASPDEVPGTLRDAVVTRVERLSPAARNVLDAACVVPNRIERWLLEALLDGDQQAIGECLDSGMLRPVEDGFGFRHDLARRALEAELPSHRRRELHLKIRLALSDRGYAASDPARLVYHAEEAGDRKAVLFLAPQAASQAAALGAHRQAAAHYRTAIRFATDQTSEVRAGLLEGLSYECYLINEPNEALDTRFQALELWQSLGRDEKEGETQRWLSRLLWFVGRNSEAREHGDAAIETLERVGGHQLAMAYSNRSQLYMLEQENPRAIQWGQKAIALAREINDREALVHALNNVGSSEWRAGDAQGRQKVEESLALALAEDFPEHVARAYTNLATLSVQRRDYEASDHYLQAGISYCTEQDLDSWSDYMRAWRARVLLERGLWDQAAAEAKRLVERPGIATVSLIPALTVLAAVQVRRGDLGAEEILERADPLARDTGEVQRIAPLAVVQAESDWWNGKGTAVLERLEPIFELARKHPQAWTLGEVSIWMWRAGGLQQPPRAIAGTPYELEIRGNWRAAAVAWNALGCSYDGALALASSEDEELLSEALAVCEDLAAKPAAEWIRRKLS